MSDSTESRPKLEALKAILNQTLRISASDGRTFVGTFACVDKQKNVILTNTDEYREGGPVQGRYVAMVMIPWKLVRKVEAQMRQAGYEHAVESLYT